MPLFETLKHTLVPLYNYRQLKNADLQKTSTVSATTELVKLIDIARVTALALGAALTLHTQDSFELVSSATAYTLVGLAFAISSN